MKFYFWSEWMIRDVIDGGERTLPETFDDDWLKMCEASLSKAVKEANLRKDSLSYDINDFEITTNRSVGFGVGANKVIIPQLILENNKAKKVRRMQFSIKHLLQQELFDYDSTFLSIRTKCI